MTVAGTICVYLPPLLVNRLNGLFAGRSGPPPPLRIVLHNNLAQFRLIRELWTRDLLSLCAWILLLAFFLSLPLYSKLRRLIICMAAWALFLIVTRRVVLASRIWLFLLPICLMAAAAAIEWLFERVTPSSNRAAAGAVAGVVFAVILAAPVLRKRSILDSTETGVLKSAPQIAAFIVSGNISPDRVFVNPTSDLPLQYYLWRRNGSRPDNASRQELERRKVYEAWFLLNFADRESLDMFAAQHGFKNIRVLSFQPFDGACLYYATWAPSA